ncbi:ribosome biogenesis protein Nop53/GLTSCR2 [Fimicolochytrium jonesii]|uniref:ribosome biogenesis protein Nop53/GLTSCR2 n=1 Tax=Fimicolochytrium jonesii TaxID=1396493 RepID=UPI0022FE5565|nr:ribosome biogenesis protein Nop53/GLTSCR2 [Fimicolochytrium jonesii]KAI8825694.1 ribosome biogenesis protein Nop53/GLTSCR2 [Fimicolochytrium jonesii]
MGRAATTSATAVATTPAKKAQPGRKGKKAWRKNVDSTEVEEQLHELRNEERIGGGKLYTKANADLFFTDKSGDAEIKRKFQFKKLKIDEILQPTSAMDGVLSRPTAKSTVKVAPEGMKARNVSKSNVEAVEKLAKRKAESGLARVGASAEAKAAASAAKKRKLEQKKGGFDLWDAPETETTVIDSSLDVAYIEPTLKKSVKKPLLPDTLPKGIKAVEVSHAGASYNPSFDDHQKALREAVDEETEKIDTKAKTLKKLSYPAELDNLDDETFFDDDSEEEEENEAETSAATGETTVTAEVSAQQTFAAPVVVERKTRVDRNKEERRAALEREQKAAKEAKKLDKQLNRLGELKKIVSKEERIRQARLEEREREAVEKANNETRRLGPHAFKPAPMDIQLTEELADSLRELKPEGNLFRDRFTSLQKRTLIEARVPISKNKKLRYKRKLVETHDYKRFK